MNIGPGIRIGNGLNITGLITSGGGSSGIVTNGLIVYLDAGNPSSYSGSGSSWLDLSGNGNNFTLVNSPTYSSSNGGYLNFNGINQYANTSYQQPAQSSTTSFTWCAWIYPLLQDDPPLIGCRNSSLIFTKLTSNKFEYYPTFVGSVMTTNAWKHYTIVKDNANFYYYTNGVLSASGSNSSSKTAIPFFVGGDNLAAEYSTSRISFVNVYHRALNLSEINQNFNFVKSRYGL
jgi:hypothetical protein